MKNNYEAWNIEVEDFYKIKTNKERMRFILRFGVLAPSSHNSQPWAFEIGENYILVKEEGKRSLPVGDFNSRQAIISIGCAIENITTAAEFYGFTTEVIFNDQEKTAKINFLPDRPSSTFRSIGHPIFSIPKRAMNRGKYLDKELGGELLERINSLQAEDLKLYILTDRKLKNDLADIALEATSSAMANPSFRSELSEYIISNTSRLFVGMPGFTLGFPAPVSYFASAMLKRFDLSKFSNKADGKVLKDFTPYISIIATKNDDYKAWINTGRFFQKMALLLTSDGVSVAVWAAPVQIGEYHKKLQSLLKTDYRPQMFFRMGFAKKAANKHSPRLPTDDVIE